MTVSPLYYSSYGAHLKEVGKRLENWEHLDPKSKYFMTQNPLPNLKTTGHGLNMLMSSNFLASVGRQPWEIVRYQITFENKVIPSYVDRSVASELALNLKEFKFVGRKVR